MPLNGIKKTPSKVDTTEAQKNAILWLIEGNRSEDVAEKLLLEYPGIDVATVITAAGDHFATVAKSDETVIIGWALESCREIYRRMIDIGDYTGALRAVSEMVKHSKRLEDVYSDSETTESLED